MNLNRNSILLAFSALGVLAACASPIPDAGPAARLSAPYVEAQLQYRFAGRGLSLASGERGRISGFFSKLALRKGDLVIVTVPSSGTAHTDAKRLGMMQSLLHHTPAKKQFLMAESFGSRPTPTRQVGIIRVARAQGIGVDCQPSIDDLGCAGAINLAVMIHEPGDVLEPDTTAYIARRNTVALTGEQ